MKFNWFLKFVIYFRFRIFFLSIDIEINKTEKEKTQNVYPSSEFIGTLISCERKDKLCSNMFSFKWTISDSVQVGDRTVFFFYFYLLRTFTVLFSLFIIEIYSLRTNHYFHACSLLISEVHACRKPFFSMWNFRVQRKVIFWRKLGYLVA